MAVLSVAMTTPAALYILGAWLETIGTIDGLADEFYSRWPLATIGSVLAVLMALRM
jgi:hypothetical protein